MKRLNRQIPLALVCIGVVLLLGDVSRAGSGEKAAGTTLTVGVISAASGLDPFLDSSEFANASELSLYDTLLKEGQKVGPGGLLVPDYRASRIRPSLAESWSLSDGGRTITLHLRKGVVSHAGNELTANDVQYTWDRALATNGEGTFHIKNVLVIPTPSWHVIDKYTWQVTLPKPNHLLLLELWQSKFSVVFDSTEAKKHATSSDPWSTAWLKTHDAGFGPYKLESYNPGTSVVLVRYDQYWGKKPYFDHVILREVPSAANRESLVRAGVLDAAMNVPPRDLAQLQHEPKVHVWSNPGNTVSRLAFNLNKKPFNNILFREALNYATPVDAIRKAVYFGFASPLRSSPPSTHPDYAPQFWHFQYNLNKARQLLTRAGLAKGGYTLDINYDGGSDIQRQLVTLLASAYRQAGIPVVIRAQPSATFFDLMTRGGGHYGAWVYENFPIVPDVGYFFSWAYTCGGSFNPQHYCNKAFDKAVYAGIQSSNPATIRGAYTQAQKILVQSVPEVWLSEPGFQMLTGADIKGVGFTPAHGPYWAQWSRG
jgi:peptide/nickel transport system substrate-binding protein